MGEWSKPIDCKSIQSLVRIQLCAQKIYVMDKFKECQYHYIDPGGIKCQCCNYFRTDKRINKRLNRMARARLKRDLLKEIHNE